MAKGSVRKKGKKWYYRFYVEDASGNLVQKECVGTESKSETEKLLRQAMDDYEKKKFVAKADNLTVGQLLDVWAEEELKTGTLSNGTVENYLGTIRNIKKHPLAERKLKNVTSEHLQSFFDLLSFGGVHPDGKERKGYSKDYIHSFSAVMQQSFRFAVFPKQYITFNPMQYIKLRYQTDEVDLFSDEDMELLDVPENVLPYFDFEAYGRDMRINEGGHFAPTGYLTRSGDFKEVYHGIEDIPAEHRIFAYPKLNIREQMAAYKEVIDRSSLEGKRLHPRKEHDDR